MRFRRWQAGQHPLRPLGWKGSSAVWHLWNPGSNAIVLFAETDFPVANSDIASCAYSTYLIPDKDEWILILNRNVTSQAYGERQDPLLACMQTGELLQKITELTIYFGRVAPRACDMRVDYGTTRTWIEFGEKEPLNWCVGWLIYSLNDSLIR